MTVQVRSQTRARLGDSWRVTILEQLNIDAICIRILLLALSKAPRDLKSKIPQGHMRVVLVLVQGSEFDPFPGNLGTYTNLEGASKCLEVLAPADVQATRGNPMKIHVSI